jgi:DNA repair photolyase
MPDVLRVLIKHRNPVFILTKSPLILRDYDLIGELSSKATVYVASTITTLNEDIRKKIEPNTCPSMDRVRMLHEFSKLKCRTNAMLMPIIPYLTDSMSGIGAIYHSCRMHRVNGVIPAILHLRGELKDYFYRFLRAEFPDVLLKIRRLYRGSYVDREYSEKLYRFIRQIESSYKFFRNKNNSEKTTHASSVQLSLFDGI